MAIANNRVADGTMSWDAGVDSSKVTTLKNENNPRGLNRNQLAWLQNGSVRGGGISPRTGWQRVTTIVPSAQLYGGGFMYDPPGDNLPFLVLEIGGVIYTVRLDTDNSVVQLVPGGPLSVPNKTGWSFKQAEEFLIMQPGDALTRPVFFYPVMPLNGNYVLRQSAGYVAANSALNEIPEATSMDYFMGRVWYARGRQYSAGDIVGSQATGTLAYNFRDSVLHVTENPLAIGGDGFIIPSQDGHIRALAHTSNVNKALGEGDLYIFTRQNIYSLKVPVTRIEWINSTSDVQPIQTVVQRKFGATGERSVVPVNGDLFYRTMEPGVRSLSLTVRNAAQWGNTPISNNVDRLLGFDDRQLLRFATGVEFNNRLYESCNPVDIPGVGVGSRGLVVLDFDRVSSLDDILGNTAVPTWEGAYSGLNILQLFTGDFGGRQRCFAVIFSDITNAIELWELTDFARRENGDNRIEWYFETPSFTWNEPFSMKELDGGELWIDQLSGTVDFDAYYRPDQYPCWIPWAHWTECSSRGPQEDVPPIEIPYPTQPYCDQYRAPMVLPKPGVICVPGQSRPSNLGYQFQFRLVVRGWCRVRGLILYALPRLRPPFDEKFVCGSATTINDLI